MFGNLMQLKNLEINKNEIVLLRFETFFFIMEQVDGSYENGS